MRCLDRIVANDGALSSELLEVLNEVENKGVVVIDNQDPGSHVLILSCNLPPMPKSRIRKKKKDNRPQQDLVVENPLEMESPRWLVPVMLGAFLIGLAWIVTFYISQTAYPIPDIGAWNMVVGFAFIGVGFSLATRWR